MAGTLYLVPTPIGNLGDISRRCAETLEAVDLIAAEDTRVTLKLLNHLDLKKPLVSYYRHNTDEAGEKILTRLLAGENVALVTDAGTPAVSDPGEDLVALCARHEVPVVALPGPCALTTALSVSGLPTGRFTFEGFLPMNKKKRCAQLEELKTEKRTMIFYEAPHKLTATLADLRDTFGPDRRVSLCRELTKLHEEVIRTTLAEAAALYREKESADAAHVRHSKYVQVDPSSGVWVSSMIFRRRSWPQEASMSPPSFRRTVAVTPWLSSRCWNCRTRRLGLRGDSATSFRGMRFTCPGWPRSSLASRSACSSPSFTPSTMAYS